MSTTSPDVLSDEHRLQLLERSGVLDTPPEEAFDRLTRLAATYTGAPVALVSFVDPDRQFFKSCFGPIPEPYQEERQTPLSHSFCQHVVRRAERLVVEDARDHPLVWDNLAVPDLGVRAYAGIPIVAPDGSVLGSFCAIDSEPREWTEEELSVLEDLAGSVNTEIALRLELAAEQERQEELRQARDQAQAAARARSAFLANMSHEIRTPMNTVVGMTNLVLDMGVDAEVKSYLNVVRNSGNSLLRIIDDLLDFSRMEAGGMELDPSPFDLRATLADVLRGLAVQADERGVELALEVAEDVPDRVVGDVGRIRQIVTNLAGNAVKFTEEGEVVVRAARSDDESAGDVLRLLISVEDTGIGIPEEKLDAIFESFAQADASTSRRFGGTGLGLPITRQLAELMDGEVRVESELGRGSTFEVRLAVRPAESAPHDGVDDEGLAGLRVLLVDDHRTQREILSDMLRRRGVDVSAVSGGEEALTRLREQPSGVDVLLVDETMPGMDGRELAGVVAELDDERRPAVVLLASAARRSEGGRPESGRKGSPGVDGVVLKPTGRSELLEAMAKAVRRRSGEVEEEADRPLDDGTQATGSPLSELEILVAEDNHLNQRLVRGILERAGIEATVVDSGEEAVSRWEEKPFSVVLMDVQMPGMDGLEATRRIRSLEASRDGAPTSIIALTAHATPKVRERCRAAGMDHYLTKPLDADRLLELLHREARRRHPETVAGEETSTGDAEATDDASGGAFEEDLPSSDVLLEAVGGDPDLLVDVIDLWIQEADDLLGAVRQAAEDGRATDLEKAAHKLRGAVSNFHVPELVVRARALEERGVAGETDGLRSAVEELEEGVKVLNRHLTSTRARLASE